MLLHAYFSLFCKCLDIIISGIPIEVYDFKLCQRSALEWIIDQYKAKPTNSTVLEYFNDYDYSQYKEEIISLISKVVTVSLETNKIINMMKINK